MNLFKKKNKDKRNSMVDGVGMITVSDPKHVITEEFNTIRTNIQFSNIDKEIKSIMITSSTQSEGKSTISANLAAAFARQGKRTLLIDVDLRRPTIAATFKGIDQIGLTNYLTGNNFHKQSLIHVTSMKNLSVIPSGPIPPNPSELLGSKKMAQLMNELSEKTDIVIYDAPPVLAVTDAQVLANQVDGTIIVTRENVTQKREIANSTYLLKHVNANIIGTILNDSKDFVEGYYGYYGGK